MRGLHDDEHILEDDYPVYCDYWYVVDNDLMASRWKHRAKPIQHDDHVWRWVWWKRFQDILK